MSNLEELSLYIHTFNGSTFIAGTDLDNKILTHMPQLHTFTFYIASQNAIADSTIRISELDIKRTFTKLKVRQVGCMVDYINHVTMICRIFSLPFKFHRLDHIGNNIPNIVFKSVTHLALRDKVAFIHKFFVRLARAFPFLKSLSIWNMKRPFSRVLRRYLSNEDRHSIVEYPHLISLDIECVNSYYVEHFLNETKIYLPRLTKLKVTYENLEDVTKNFTRDETRHNCARVKQLIVDRPIVYSKGVYYYFPLLSA